jgi:hypothetical protein
MTPKLIAVAFVVIVASVPIAQTQPIRNNSGPRYSAAAIRQMEVEGVHLGMARERVRAEMAARGFQRTSTDDGESNFHSDLYIRANDHLETRYLGRGQLRVARMSFIHLTRPPVHQPLSAVDRAADRQFLVQLFGEPTSSRVFSEHYEEYVYTPRPLADDASTITGCYFGWQCQTALYNADCPRTIQRNPKVIIVAIWTDTGPGADIIDLEAYAPSLLRNHHFVERNTRAEACITVPIH